MNETVKKERAEALAEHIARQVFNLALDYLPKIEKAGSESDKGEAKSRFHRAGRRCTTHHKW